MDLRRHGAVIEHAVLGPCAWSLFELPLPVIGDALDFALSGVRPGLLAQQGGQPLLLGQHRSDMIDRSPLMSAGASRFLP